MSKFKLTVDVDAMAGLVTIQHPFKSGTKWHTYIGMIEECIDRLNDRVGGPPSVFASRVRKGTIITIDLMPGITCAPTAAKLTGYLETAFDSDAVEVINAARKSGETRRKKQSPEATPDKAAKAYKRWADAKCEHSKLQGQTVVAHTRLARAKEALYAIETTLWGG